ncbi:hypothetical protein JOC76_002502 [Neobacillus cucumis]|uniref:hypothetical protein n=1 Tax=Neobacillus cucumis TaxID=1740721 RepID=UPI00196456AD|nr:hypothetical protein [Neobacillus cucumis]MBM7653044.1 hypothetical protein [Neobacillus cucumis]
MAGVTPILLGLAYFWQELPQFYWDWLIFDRSDPDSIGIGSFFGRSDPDSIGIGLFLAGVTPILLGLAYFSTVLAHFFS